MLPLNIGPAVYALLAKIVGSLILIGLIAFGIHHYGSSRFDAGDKAGYERGHAEATDIQTRWDADKAMWQASSIAAVQDRDKRMQDLATQNERITHEKEHIISGLRVGIAAAGTELGRLREQTSAFAASATCSGAPDGGAGSARVSQAAATLAELFSESAGRYASLAAEADLSYAAGAECVQRYEALKAVGGKADGQ